MNSEAQQILRAEFELLKQEIIAKYESSGMAASGNWGRGVQLQQLPHGFSIVADGYINGRPPGRQPPSEAILQWIKQKGIAARLGSQISLGSLAYLIARKIAKNGWKPAEGYEDIVGSVATPQRIQQIIDKAGQPYIAGFTTEILQYLTPA